jgi:hypothetical protein
MSRIDEALKRLAGVAVGEQPTPQVLDRYSSEDRQRVDDVKRAARSTEARATDHKISNFVSQGPVPVPPPGPIVPRVSGNANPAAADASAQARRSDQPVVVTMAQEPEIERLIDVKQIADYVGFVVRSVGRHKFLAAGTFCLVLGLTVVASLVMPKTYYVQVKLLAQRNAVMRALSNPNTAVPWDADAPTRAAAETVLRRDNLISLVTQTDLVNEWDRRRAPFLKFKDPHLAPREPDACVCRTGW